MKKLIQALLVASIAFTSSAYAQFLPVAKDFNTNNIVYNKANSVSNFENDQLKVSVDGLIYKMYNNYHPAEETFQRMNDLSNKQIYSHWNLTTIGTNYYIFICEGVKMSFENKTLEPLYIDLNSSVISIGEYYGKPLLEGIRFMDAASATLPPLVIMPNQKVQKTLYRNDHIYKYSDWIVEKEDFYLDKNILGNFLFAIGLNEKKLVPMQFSVEADSNSITPYIDAKKKASMEKFIEKMNAKLKK